MERNSYEYLNKLNSSEIYISILFRKIITMFLQFFSTVYTFICDIIKVLAKKIIIFDFIIVF